MSKLTLTKENKIALLTINRPEVKNALDLDTYEAFGEAVNEVKEDSDIRVMVITGAGDSFCAGVDLKCFSNVNELSSSESVVNIQKTQQIFAFENISKPVISAVNGYALGNGCDIAIASDFVIASENASFAMAYTNLAIIPDLGGTFRLPRLVGLAAARELILTGEKIDAKRALEIGMIGRVVPREQLMDNTMQFAEKLAKRAPVALAMAKSAINKSLSSDLSASLQLESYMQTLCFQCQDVMEAATAMFEKREPEFKGK